MKWKKFITILNFLSLLANQLHVYNFFLTLERSIFTLSYIQQIILRKFSITQVTLNLQPYTNKYYNCHGFANTRISFMLSVTHTHLYIFVPIKIIPFTFAGPSESFLGREFVRRHETGQGQTVTGSDMTFGWIDTSIIIWQIVTNFYIRPVICKVAAAGHSAHKTLDHTCILWLNRTWSSLIWTASDNFCNV